MQDYDYLPTPAEWRRGAGEPCESTVQAEKNIKWSRDMFVSWDSWDSSDTGKEVDCLATDES